jgi:hypothetical protein
MPCYCCCKAMEGLECARRFRRHSARTLLLGAFVRVVHNGTGWIAPQAETLSSSDELSFDKRESFLARDRVSGDFSSADASADASGVSQCASGLRQRVPPSLSWAQGGGSAGKEFAASSCVLFPPARCDGAAVVAGGDAALLGT